MADRDEVIANLRAVLISRKDPATLYQLGRDYRELDGKVVPYKQYGFPSLESFLRSDPTFKLYRQGNDVYVAVEPKKESRHISDMIAKQKSNKKRPRSAPPPRALRSGSDRNSRWAPSPTIWNTRSPARTSKSAQLYSGQPSRQLSLGPHRNGNPIRGNSVQDRLVSVQNSTSQLKAIENITPNTQPHNSVAYQPIRGAGQQPVRSTVRETIKTVVQEPIRSVESTKSVAQIPQVKPVNNSNSKLTNGETLTGRDLKNSQVPEVSKKPAVRFELLPGEDNKKEFLPKSSKVEGLKTQNIPENNKFVKENLVTPEMTKKRSIIDLETVKSTNSRSVNVVPPSKNNEYGNIQVTMSNNTLVNNNSCVRTGDVVKTSAQDRLSRIRQDQPPAVPSLECPRISKPKQSQQSRLQKYRTQDVVLDAQPACPQEPNVVTAPTASDADKTSENSLVYERLLIEFCSLKNIPIQEIKAYKHTIPHNLRTKSDRPMQVFGCTIKVGGKYSYGSYSDKYTTSAQAVDEAAHEALDALTKIYGTLEERNLPVTDGRLVPQRLLKIVAGHTNGKFLHQLPGEYREEFHENLPEDWMNYVDLSRLFHIEGSIGGSQIIFVRQALTFTDKGLKANSEDFIQLSKMVLPEQEGFWNVLITHVCSTVEVWARILGEKYNGLYENLTAQMEIDFVNKKVSSVKPQLGGHYAVSTAECWMRVQILEIKELEALCFHIDTGEEEWHKNTDIYKLDKKYRFVPPQGVLLQLSGLQEYAENKYALKHLIESLLDKTLVAEIVQSECDGTVISVVLYDTYTNDDINLNANLLKKIKDEAKVPTLKEKGMVNQVYVSHVTDDGDVFIQIRNDSFKYLHTQIQIMTDVGFGDGQLNDCTFLSTMSTEKLYLTVNADENKCYRVKVTGPPVGEWVPVFFVDYGYTGMKEMSKLHAIHKLSTAIDDYPHQALKVKMKGIPTFTSAIASRLRGSLPVNLPVLLKVFEPGTVPVVEVFMRTHNDLLVSLNNALQNEIEIERKAEEVECRPVSRHITSASITQNDWLNTPLPPSPESKKIAPISLPEPKIPCDGSFFQVMVTMAASPANFVIQPYKEENVLKNMMSDLQCLCKNSPSQSPAHSAIKKGNIYAGKHTDGNWYRIQVTNVMSNKSVSVHFCDYGDYNVMSSKNLQRLTEPFLKIPYFAVRARLADITTHDWSVTDCLTFQQLVCDKVFDSVLRSIDTDELNPSEKILNIILIDSENGVDRYITPELIRRLNC